MNEPVHSKTAQGLASMGRYGDSMLVHMTPGEVAGLQSLAVANGTSLTINPKTGLPEAFILAPLVGLGLKAAGMSALGAGIATGLLGWAVTGNLGQGLMSGLGGYGGAELGGTLGKLGSTVTAVPETAATPLLGGSAAASSAPSLTSSALSGANAVPLAGGTPLVTNAAPYVMPTANQVAAGVTNAAGAVNLANTTVAGAPSVLGGLKYAAANPLEFIKNNPGAAFTAASPLLAAASKPPEYKPLKEEKTPYEGPYYPTERTASFPTDQERQQLGTKEYQYFNPTHPYPGYESYDPNYRGYAEGGDVNETPDPGSDPRQDAQEAMQYGIGGIARFADGGNTAEKNYGLASAAGNFKDPNSIPSAAFQADLDAYNKRVKDLRNPGIGSGVGALTPLMPYGLMGTYNPIYGRFDLYPGLTQAQAEAKAGPKPVWQAPTAPQAPAPGPTSAYQGSGVTSLPPRQPTQNLNLTGGFSDMSRDIINSGGAFAKGGYLDGPGDGMSDSIPATIANKQPARLADGEFVVPADVVSHLGNGSTKAGAQRLYAMMDKVRKARTGTTKQGKQINPHKYMPA